MGGSSNDVAWALTIDAGRNTYVTGYYQNTADFDPGPAVTNLISKGSTDIFLAKYDLNCNYLFAKSMGGISGESSLSISLDNLQNVLIGGYFFAVCDFDPGIGIQNLQSLNGQEIFFAKYNQCPLVPSTINNNQTQTIAGTTTFTNGCGLIARLTPNGSNPVSGSVVSKVFINANPLGISGTFYLNRHFEIAPSTNANTATGRVTLFLTQAEFNTLNSYLITNFLPTGPTDSAGMRNIRIIKYSGISSDGSGLPATYSGTPEFLNPDDSNVVWIPAYNRWEISIDVTSFSGFFISNVQNANYCPGSNIILTCNISGTTYQWQLDSGSGFTNLTEGGNYNGVNTNSLTISNTPGNFYNYKYRCVVDGTLTSQVISIKALATWLGSVSTVWENPSNWGCNIVPDANSDVFVGSSLLNPVINNNTTIRALTVADGAIVSVSTGVILTILK